MLSSNQVLNKGRYRIINLFDQDETGGSYEALDTESNTNVVLRETIGVVGKVATVNQLKEINEAFAGRASTLKEARHDSLVSVQDYFSEIDRQYLVLEPMTGIDLTRFLSGDAERPPLAQILSWMDQVLDALSYLHGLSTAVIHGDIRPQNIKFTSSLKAKLLIDRVPAGPDATCGNFDNETLSYRPLEQIWTDLDETSQRVIFNSYDERSAGELLRAPDARSDIYSFAATFYHVLTGTVPADALDRSISILDGNADTLINPSKLDPSVPPEIADAFMRAMAIRRENRYDTAPILRQVLRTAVTRLKERGSAVPVTPSSHIRQPEPKIADQRQLDIEAEQARLDEERKRIEQRQMELEAEKERHAAEQERVRLEAEAERQRLEKQKLEEEAEKERQRIAQLMADLEAERAQKRAEDERLEREAEAERHRAEERLREIHAEQERHRSEQIRLELEAQQELERAEQRLKELSGVDLDISEPERTHEPSDIPEFGFAPPVETREAHADLEQDETTVPAFLEQPAASRRVPVMVAAGLLIVAAVAAAWFFLLQDQRASVPTVPQQASSPVEETAVPPVQDMPASLVDQQQASDPVQAAAEIPVTLTEDDPSVEGRSRSAQTQVSSVRAKPRKPAPAAPVPAKKKVTVDDLINDN